MITNIKNIILSLLIIVPSFYSYGQQLPMYTQYKLNQVILNPATAGAEAFTTFNLTARQQWLGFKGSPNTYTLSGQGRVLRRRIKVSSGLLGIKRLQKRREGKVGLGGVIFKDKNGPISRTGLSGAYAYHIAYRHSQLSFGLAITAYQFKVEKDELTFPDPGTEPLLSGSNKLSFFAPDASVGVNYITKTFYAGLAVDQLFQSGLKIAATGYESKNQFRGRYLRQYYVMSGYSFRLWVDYYLEPSVLIKLNERFRSQEEINVKVYYRDDYWGGISYRLSPTSLFPNTNDMVIMGGIRYDDLYFAYSFDYTFSQVMDYSFGSHEISVGLRLGARDEKFRWQHRY
jgi:type IX secretion system PorP/SprF family membrane protein